MPLYNFQKRFAEAVKNGTKRRTIRKKRKRITVIGDRLYMYSGLRTNHTEKLGEFICKKNSHVIIYKDHVRINWLGVDATGRFANERNITKQISLDKFAQLDGIENFEIMKRYFEKVHGQLPFIGEMIEW